MHKKYVLGSPTVHFRRVTVNQASYLLLTPCIINRKVDMFSILQNTCGVLIKLFQNETQQLSLSCTWNNYFINIYCYTQQLFFATKSYQHLICLNNTKILRLWRNTLACANLAKISRTRVKVSLHKWVCFQYISLELCISVMIILLDKNLKNAWLLFNNLYHTSVF